MTKRSGVRLSAALLLSLAVLPAWADTFTARLVRLKDGDTIVAEMGNHRQRTIRLAWIDTPEKRQSFGPAATTQLTKLLGNRTFALDCPTVDRNKRDVCGIQLDGQDINLALVKAGAAWWSRDYAPKDPGLLAAYKAAEQSARDARVGLWQDENPIPPWEWRRQQRAAHKRLN